VYHIAEGRIGPDGQAINRYLNKRTFQTQSSTYPDVGSTTPYIWIATVFDIDGNVRPLQSGGTSSTVSIYPTYQMYKTSAGVSSFAYQPQEDVEQFIALDALWYFKVFFLL
jgi:hypothetical protein